MHDYLIGINNKHGEPEGTGVLVGAIDEDDAKSWLKEKGLLPCDWSYGYWVEVHDSGTERVS